MKDKYKKLLADHVTISLEDLTPSENAIIDKSFELFDDKLNDIKVLNDEVKRLSLELANLKAMGTADDARYEYKQSGVCPTCGHSPNEDESY